MPDRSVDADQPSCGGESPRFPPIVSLEHVSTDELWDMLIADAVSEAKAGRAVPLRRYLMGLPHISDHTESLHAAIAATIENRRHLGHDRVSILLELKQDHPDLAEQIDHVELIEEIVGSGDEVGGSDVAPQPTLPCPYGPKTDTHPHRYVLHELVGAGTRGYVYKALDQTTSSPDKPIWVAIKIVPEWAGMDRDEVLSEARRAARVDHDAVARVIETGTDDDGGCYIVCEYIDGHTLVDEREANPQGIVSRTAVRMLLPAIEAMAAAHMGGLVHLDIHPRNILIDKRGRAKLVDFGHGAAKFEAWRPARRPLGSLGFIAPEIYQRDPDPLLSRADVYSLAGILLWFISGRIPNGGTIEESEHRLGLPIESGQIPKGLKNIGLDEDLASIISKALSRQPAERYDTAQGFAADLHAWLRHHPIAWTRPTLARRARLISRRSPGLVVGGAAFILICILATSVITRLQIEHAADLRVAEAERQADVARVESERLA
ncbi:MAG: serine/threonine protein kinase, partial [Phycisphaerales bacterium]|nr:serine/threonine protein kinase [Phycisphaerales bacterium]